MRNHILKFLLAFSFLVATFSYADVFNTLNYSGRIVNSDGSPKEGPVDLVINFYDSESGGASISSIGFSSTSLTNGTFNLEIVISDSNLSTVLDSSTDTWIELADSTNSTVYPRQKLSSVPYASRIPVKSSTFHWDDKNLDLTHSCSNGQILKFNSGSWQCASDATSGGGGTIVAGDIASDAIETAKIQDSAVTSAKIADGTLIDADFNASAGINSSKLADGSVSNTEFQYLNGVTSSIQTQLDSKASTASLGTLATLGSVNSSTITDNSVANIDIHSTAAIDTSKLANGTVSNTEFQYLNGVTSSIQSQLDAKENSSNLGSLAYMDHNQDVDLLPDSASSMGLSMTQANVGINNSFGIIMGNGSSGSGSGDPMVSFEITSVGGWSVGIDNDDSSKFKIASSASDLATDTEMTITNDGYLGIGTSNPQYPIHITTLNNGTIPNFGYLNQAGTGTLSGTTVPISIYASSRVVAAEFNAFSDRRVKKDIEEISRETAIHFIEKSRPVHYTMKETGVHNYGFIAQEIDKLDLEGVVNIAPKEGLKETVDQDGYISPQDHILQMNYDQLVSVLTKSVQEFYADFKQHVKEIKLFITKWENENLALKAEIKDLKNQNKMILDYLCDKDPDASMCEVSQQ